MENYLGETEVPIEKTPYKGFTAKEWALLYVYSYGQIDGEHHKQWVIDQMVRILKGTPVIVKLAKWGNGCEEYRFTTGEPSKEYRQWVENYKNKGEYSYDEGIAP
jgi:hypothetical protein